MTREQLFEAIGALDEAMLDQNVEEVKKHRFSGWITGIAACAAIIIGIVCLPRILPQKEIPSQSGIAATEASASEPSGESATEFAGFLDGMHYYPLPDGSAADAVCEDGEWLATKLGDSAYFVLNESLGLYQFIDPLSSALPETGTYTIKDMVITALSYDGEDFHKFSILEDGYALELTESTCWEHLSGRVFTSRYDAEKPFSDITAAQISNVICNDWEITLDDTQMDAFVYHLRNVVRYQQITAEEEPRDGGRFIRFTLNENGEASEIIISHRLWMDGMKYLPDQESCNALFDLLIPLAEDAQEAAEHTPKTLSYLQGVTYRQLAADFSHDSAYNDMTQALDEIMEIELRSGNYRIRFSNGTQERGLFSMENGHITCVSGDEIHVFSILDDYTIRLVSSSYEALNEREDLLFTCRLYPEQYFAENVTDAKGIRCGIRNGEEVISVQLPEHKVSECLDALHEITVYSESIGELSQNTIDTEKMDYLFIERIGDAQDVQVYIGKYIAIDGKIYVYETDTADALYALLEIYRTENIPDSASVLGDLENFTRVEITHYVLGEHREMTDGEFAQLKALLRNIVLQEEDTSGDMLFGDTLTYTLYKENGVSVTIQPGGNLITIGSRRFYTEYAPCEALNQFGHNILGTSFAESDYQPTAEKNEADAIFGILTNYISASISFSNEMALVSGDKLDALLESLKRIEILGKYTGDAWIGYSGIRIIFTSADKTQETFTIGADRVNANGTCYECTSAETLEAYCYELLGIQNGSTVELFE